MQRFYIAPNVRHLSCQHLRQQQRRYNAHAITSHTYFHHDQGQASVARVLQPSGLSCILWEPLKPII